MSLHTILHTSRAHGFGHRLITSSLIRIPAWRAASTQPDQSVGLSIEPPFKRHRDSLSVLRALTSCVTPSAETPDFRLGGDPWLGSTPNTRNFLLAKAKGRLAARLAIRDYFPNDIVAVAKEIPRIDRWLPLQTPDSILKRVSDGELSPSEGMNRLILLLAPTHAWKLYTDLAPDEPWTSEVLHRLLDLLCATNSGSGGAHNHCILDAVDLTSLPDPEEFYFAEELAIQFDRTRDRIALGRPAANALRDEKKLVPTPDTEDKSETQVETSSSSESESDTEEEDTAINIAQPVGRCTWLVQGPAEQLFTRAHSVLHTPAGYASMIRGAAKFHHPRRALELLQAAQDADLGQLNTAVYVSLIRCLHALPTPEIQPQIKQILEYILSSGNSLPLSVFEAALYCLAEFAQHRSTSNQVAENFVPFGLGLLSALRQTGLEPNLGVMANLLRLIHFTPLEPTGSNEYPRGYACSSLVDSFLAELDRRFKAVPPTRFDDWSMDDYTFFPIAMRIASMENNPELGQRVDHLLTGTQDRRFFLATSWHRRSYIQSYCLSQMNLPSLGTELERDPVRLIERVDQFYRTHWGTIVITNQLCTRLITFLQRFFSCITSATAKPTDSMNQPTARYKALQTAQLIAFHCLSRLLNDLLDLSRSPMEYRMPKAVEHLIVVLAKEAHCDPTVAAQTSAAVLKRLTQIDEKLAQLTSKASTEQSSSRTRPDHTLPASVIADLVRMVLPLLSGILVHDPLDASDHAAEVRWRTELNQAVNTLYDWVQYANAHEAVAWSWVPESLHLLLEHNPTEQSIDTYWGALRALTQKEWKPADSVEAKRVQRALTLVLDSLESYLIAPAVDGAPVDSDPATRLARTEQRQLIAQLRQMLRNTDALEPKLSVVQEEQRAAV